MKPQLILQEKDVRVVKRLVNSDKGLVPGLVFEAPTGFKDALDQPILELVGQVPLAQHPHGYVGIRLDVLVALVNRAAGKLEQSPAELPPFVVAGICVAQAG